MIVVNFYAYSKQIIPCNGLDILLFLLTFVGRKSNHFKVVIKQINLGDFVFKSLQMSATIITTEDLREFKIELLDDIKQLLNNQSGQVTKKWLKSPEVRDLIDQFFHLSIMFVEYF